MLPGAVIHRRGIVARAEVPARKEAHMGKGIRKGIILAGGSGSRLYPLSRVSSKQLMPVYDKPMIYYPLTTLMLAGIDDFLLISTPEDLPRFKDLLGNGSQWGVSIRYCMQKRPEGIAQAFVLGWQFIGEDPVALILGDNIFYGHSPIPEAVGKFEGGATVFGYQVQDPERYGVIEFEADTRRPLSIQEKPSRPRSHYAVPGLYLFDSKVVGIAQGLAPSPRGELEITDVIQHYLDAGELRVEPFGRGVAWLDTGLASSLQDASAFIRLIEDRQSLKIGCPEEVAVRRGFISTDEFAGLVRHMPNCQYRNYLKTILRELRNEPTYQGP